MLDIRYITTHPEQTVQRLQAKGVKNAQELINECVSANASRKKAQSSAEEVANTIKKKSKNLADPHQEDPSRREAVKEELLKLKKEYKEKLATFRAAKNKVEHLLIQLPNLPYYEVPLGDEGQNQIITTIKAPSHPNACQSLKPHWELAESYHLVDFQKGSQITGTGFPVYMGKGAALQRALIHFFIDNALAAGYQEVQPPLLINEKSAFGTGQLPDKQGMMYKVSNADAYLIPTAEVPITNLYSNTILATHQPPIRHVGYTPCFRREAGSAGANVRGLNRLHQFDKVEIVEIHKPETSMKGLQEMITYVTEVVAKLQLTYRIIKLATQELGFASAITYDIEVWSAGQEKWLEVSSISSFDDFQARRMRLRYKAIKGNTFCHTINGSALALPRILAALLEKNQTPQGILIPPALVPYTRWEIIN